MMFGVGITRIATFQIPLSDLLPGLSAILRLVQINSATNHDIWISRMDNNGIAIGDLSFIHEMISTDIFPRVSTVGTAKNTQQQILAPTGLVVSEGKHNQRI